MLRRFRASSDGNFAVNMALLAIPVMAAIGASVDYTLLSRQISQLQDAADSAALTAALEGGRKTPELVQAADNFFESNVEPELLGKVRSKRLKVTRTSTGYNYEYIVKYRFPTSLLQLVGMRKLNGTVAAMAGSGYGKTEIALVVDSTGSMGRDNKMPELKAALDGFFDRFQPMRRSVRFSIVPFDTQVRLERVRFNDPALNEADNPYSMDTDCGALSGTEYEQCVAYQRDCGSLSAGGDDDDNDDDDAPSRPPICDNTAKTSKDNDTISANSDLLGVGRLEWTGCVIDRNQPHDTTSTPVTSEATGYPPAYCANEGLQPILPLTNRINALQPSGNTNLTIGMQWGMETLTKPAPFTETEAGVITEPLRRIMIMLTDGNNTQNRWTTDSGDIDARSLRACTNVKALVDELYTIRVIEGNEALLRQCASTPEHFYNISRADDLTVVFEEIARRIASVRLIN